MNEPEEEGTPRCPVCASRHVARAVVLRGDYRCPDCSALFDSNGRIVADPRPWVDPRTQRGVEVASDVRTGEAREHSDRTGATATGRSELERNESNGERGTGSGSRGVTSK